MKSVSGKAFCRILEQHGWYLDRISSSHHIYKHRSETNTLSVPVHGNKDLPNGTQRGLMRDAGLTDKDL